MPNDTTSIVVEPTCNNDRGLVTYTRFLDSHGAYVSVCDSSTARGAAVWIFTEGGNTPRNHGAAHLDAAQARAVRDALDLWLNRAGPTTEAPR